MPHLLDSVISILTDNNEYYRYETLWLPLAAEHKALTVTAPLDIAWVWHCHLLAPVAYVKDCLRVCNSEIDHSLTPILDRRETQKLWTKKYPDVNFDIPLVENGITPPSYESRIEYDLEAAAGRQRLFYYQVSLPHYKDAKFIENAIKRYKQFLTLKRLHPDSFIVPCYDVDLIWHSHQLHPAAYKKDTEAFLGKLFNHDDSVNDRCEGSKLAVSDKETRELWQKTFGTHFSEFGAMYRGTSVKGHLFTVPKELIDQHSAKNIQLQLNKAEIPDYTSALKIHQLKISAVFRNGMDIPLLNLKKPVQGFLSAQTHNIPLYVIDTGMIEFIGVKLYNKLGGESLQGEGRISCRKLLLKCKGGSSQVTSTVRLSNGESMTLQHTVNIMETKGCDLRLEAGTFELAVIPEQNKNLWGPVPLPRLLQEGVEYKCYGVTHRSDTKLKPWS